MRPAKAADEKVTISGINTRLSKFEEVLLGQDATLHLKEATPPYEMVELDVLTQTFIQLLVEASVRVSLGLLLLVLVLLIVVLEFSRRNGRDCFADV